VRAGGDAGSRARGGGGARCRAMEASNSLRGWRIDSGRHGWRRGGGAPMGTGATVSWPRPATPGWRASPKAVGNSGPRKKKRKKKEKKLTNGSCLLVCNPTFDPVWFTKRAKTEDEMQFLMTS
jgi:hypothetical protein